jgi:UDP-glucose 4-epimerase
VKEDARGAVVVTGITGNLGRVVAKLLHRGEQVLGLDPRPFGGRPKDIEHFQLDLRKRKVDEVFKKNRVRAILHMGILHDPRMSAEDHHSFNILGTTRMLDCAAKHGVKKVVVLSSAAVYGPSPENSNFLTEDAPLMAASRFPAMRDLIEVDMLAQGFFWKHPEIETVVMRPVHIVGPTIRNAPSNYLRSRRPWMLAGFDPMVQLIHMDDVARALHEALRPGLRGVYNVVGPGEVPLSACFGELGTRPVQVLHPVARVVLPRLFRLHLSEFPAEEIDHIQYVCMVDGTRWQRETRWRPQNSMRTTIRSVLPD